MRTTICTHCGYQDTVPSQPARRIVTCDNCQTVGTIRLGPHTATSTADSGSQGGA